MTFALLALETSSSLCSVALLTADAAGSATLYSAEHDGTAEHAERLLPMADALLAQAGVNRSDLRVVAFGEGPGGFTGLRVACGVAQGLGLALGIPVIGVVSHLAVAHATPAEEGDVIVVALDARMGEMYVAAYRRQAPSGAPVVTGEGADAASTAARSEIVLRPLAQPTLIAADDLFAWAATDAGVTAGMRPILTGDAWTAYGDRLAWPEAWRLAPAARPHADSVAYLAQAAWGRGEAIDPSAAMPRYVRDKVAYTTAEREAGLGGNPKAQPRGGAAPYSARAMTPADLDDVAQLEARLQQFPWTRGNFADALEAGYDACVVRDEQALLGFCLLMMAPDVAHLLVIAVDDSRHRQGVGTYILEWCMARTANRGLPAILLEVRPSNPGALAFYARHGFAQIGVRKGYYPAPHQQREDAIVMKKTLAHAPVPHG
ncbi:tRNA (adenosine(37)-N6)-threonylcarbamoyltransferase complex dimerization subunit type 1 TsaB [Schauerella aestuarii]|uniref:tRNA (adenosine(37)-N6)-threonylcarbamoyltransferase complex dimerization subunit type 1 TsaB n=1 Tax=Schauerella aestuarii TaxID=2511204 RepID=UPI00136C5E74|nr:tRNA (adenosine(37)-N6)-threonylcarbamoyltransferase complex dimerization subunit type 1 TsaB [Achromobacter aestuarii]MYZ43105.1 tRNA (adenosine(37)-N6)-threonylcarbamoyltransferase complex dimerization subunit type 1 TsaB [Achromobacter aestuarii]